ncbi:hypothetical protein QZG57_09560 [Corynebacterium glucuronolyticum]|uniref:hypothetical protein n=1 Tax=Corynebacterium glucuronolyticum TaxID=39791 RepID=UPI003F6E13E6
MSDFIILNDRKGYKVLHPEEDKIPPLVTMDGDIKGAGKKHGRLVPMIGSTRPPVYDVSIHPFDGSKVRVYADDPDSVLAALLGEEYQDQLLRAEEAVLVAAEAMAVIREKDAPTDEEMQKTDELFQQSQAEVGLLSVIRSEGVHRYRQKAQEIINDQARSDGRWDALTDIERQILTEAADPAGETIPIGIPEPGAFQTDDGQIVRGNFGVWRADVPLVLNELDYYPWTQYVAPRSEQTFVSADGEEMVAVGVESILPIIHSGSAEKTVAKLNELGVFDVTIRPHIPVDGPFRDYEKKMIEERLARNRAEAAEEAKDK